MLVAQRLCRAVVRNWVAIVALAILLVIIHAPVAAVASAADDAADTDEVRALLREGDKLLIQGRSSYPDAAAKYTAALKLAPHSPKVAFRRADLFYMMRRWDECLEDIATTLEGDPWHKKALERHAAILSSTGRLTEAAASYEKLGTAYANAGNAKKASEFHGKARQAAELGAQLDTLSARVTSDLPMEERIAAARHCVHVLSSIVKDFASDSIPLQLRKAECAVLARHQMAASEALKYVLTREPQNLKAIAINARSLHQLGSIEGAKNEVRRCLGLDPEAAGCIAVHKQLKHHGKVTSSIEAHVKQSKWNEVIKEVDAYLGENADPPNLEQLWRWKCEGYLHERDVAKGLKACETAIDIESGNENNPQLAELYLKRADLYILDDDFDAAQKELDKAKAVQPEGSAVREFQQKLEKLKAAAARKDYYKILGVPRSANDKDIRRAYKKLALKLHPDKLRSEDMTDADREKANNRFRDINEAKEVLLDTEKRKRFDNGEDVTKPPGQEGGFHHGSHFHFQGGFPGGGFPGGFPGGFNFQFG
jgi:DnaJ family protein C protein 3